MLYAVPATELNQQWCPLLLYQIWLALQGLRDQANIMFVTQLLRHFAHIGCSSLDCRLDRRYHVLILIWHSLHSTLSQPVVRPLAHVEPPVATHSRQGCACLVGPSLETSSAPTSDTPAACNRDELAAVAEAHMQSMRK